MRHIANSGLYAPTVENPGTTAITIAVTTVGEVAKDSLWAALMDAAAEMAERMADPDEWQEDPA